jgi:CRISPR-associated protein Cas2
MNRILLAYDISQTANYTARLRQVSNLCKAYGERVQYSVFELELTDTEKIQLITKLKKIISKEDSIVLYRLYFSTEDDIHLGESKPYSLNDVLLF